MRANDQRRWLAEQAARLMHGSAIDDPMLALSRVVRRQGTAPDRRQWPDAQQIRAALQDYQRLFGGGRQVSALQLRRDAAQAAMQFLAPFHPYLVGAVLDGTADAHSTVRLHLCVDDPDEVLTFLREHGIDHDLGEARIHLSPQSSSIVPKLSFQADGVGFELMVLPTSSERQPPRDSDGHTPMPRANLARVKNLLEAKSD